MERHKLNRNKRLITIATGATMLYGIAIVGYCIKSYMDWDYSNSLLVIGHLFLMLMFISIVGNLKHRIQSIEKYGSIEETFIQDKHSV